MGIGIGMILATTVMITVKIDYNLSKSQIESKARDLGMEYPQEMKVINKQEKKKK